MSQKTLCLADSKTIVYKHLSKEGKPYFTENNFKVNHEQPIFHNCEVCNPKGKRKAKETPKKSDFVSAKWEKELMDIVKENNALLKELLKSI